MKTFTGLEYLKIDIANAAGQDKKLFEERLEWFDENIPETVVTMSNQELKEFVESFTNIDSKELMFTGLMAYKDTFYNKPTGYMCQLDAISSGASLMSCLMGDRKGLENTGLLGNKRSDLYTAIYNKMKEIYELPLSYKRDDIKKAAMTFLYGSIRQPSVIFNNDKDIIEAFWEAVKIEATGAYMLQQLLTSAWNPNAIYHRWVLPDLFTAHIPVMVEKEFTYTFTLEDVKIEIPYTLKVEGNKKSSVSNCANMIHSCDSLLIREMVRRCMFDKEHAQEVLWYLLNTKEELYEPIPVDDLKVLGKLGECIYAYEMSEFCSIRIVDEIKTQADTYKLSKQHRTKLIDILKRMLHHGYIEMIAIHDCIKSHANNMNYIRYWYKEMCADIVESNMLPFLYNQLTSSKLDSHFLSKEERKAIADDVRKSNYGLS